MKKLDSVTTTTYEIEDGFMIDIVETPEILEAWLYHRDYGTKRDIIGVEKGTLGAVETYGEFLDLVDKCIHDEDRDYIDMYREEFMDPEDI